MSKIPDRLVRGRMYNVKVRYSPKFKREVIWIYDNDLIKDTDYIYIHEGNDIIKDSDNCLLCGFEVLASDDQICTMKSKSCIKFIEDYLIPLIKNNIITKLEIK